MAEESKVIGFAKGAVKLFDTYGPFKIIISCLLMVFISYTTYLTLNPSIIFERYREYEEQKHTESFNYRMKSTPIVQEMINGMVVETGALRGFIIEMHNGKYNSSGLSFTYGSLTYEAVHDSAFSVQEDYADFTLDRYTILSKVYKDGEWSGSIEDLRKIDKRLALKLESNDAAYVALAMIYGSKHEIGFIGITFSKGAKFNEATLCNSLHKYSSRVSPYLDGNKAN